MRNTLAALSIVLLALAEPTQAEETKPANTAGLGGNTCREMLSVVGTGMSRNKPEQYALMQWALGFATGMNVMRARRETRAWNLNAITQDEIWAGIIGNCKRDGNKMVVHAIFDVVMKIPIVDLKDTKAD